LPKNNADPFLAAFFLMIVHQERTARKSVGVRFSLSYNWLIVNLFGSASITLVKAVNTSGGVHEFLLAGKKRVAFRADFDMQVFFHRRARFERIAAGADNV
jgi:hypothetical protein